MTWPLAAFFKTDKAKDLGLTFSIPFFLILIR